MMSTRPAAVAVSVLTLALATACASRGPAVPHPFPTPGGHARNGPTRTDPGSIDPGRGNPGEPAVGPPDSPDGTPAPIVASSPAAQSVIDTAIRLIGTRYRNGGADPDGFDCSGFVFYVFAQAGLAVPRTVDAQSHAGTEVGDPEAGDLVFFRTSGRGPTHVGIALGRDRFIHAPSSHGEVRIEPLARPYWAQRYLEARRLLQAP
jgi:cell wall-associated NlpC family hydrolase